MASELYIDNGVGKAKVYVDCSCVRTPEEIEQQWNNIGIMSYNAQLRKHLKEWQETEKLTLGEEDNQAETAGTKTDNMADIQPV